MSDLDAIRARAANIATGSIYSQQQTADDYQALLAEIDRRTTDLIAEQSKRQEEWDHASELLKDGVKSVSHWERETVAARAERDRYRLAWLSARRRVAGRTGDAVEAMQDTAIDLYRAEDRLAFVREMCDAAERNGQQVTTEQVRAWTQYNGCGGSIVLPEDEQQRLKAAMALHSLTGRIIDRAQAERWTAHGRCGVCGFDGDRTGCQDCDGGRQP